MLSRLEIPGYFGKKISKSYATWEDGARGIFPVDYMGAYDGIVTIPEALKKFPNGGDDFSRHLGDEYEVRWEI